MSTKSPSILAFSSTLAVVVTISLAAAHATFAQESKEFRTWTDATGKFKIEARFEKFEDDTVYLKRKDNDKVISMPSEKLSKADMAFVRKLLADRAKSKRGVQETDASDRAVDAVKLDEAMTWQGTWNNRKYGTDGPLKCTATAKDEKTWEAKFEGTGLGRPFTYPATMTATKKDKRTLLEGTSTVSGDSYQWTGYVEGDTLYGKYRSASGNNGEFRLTKPRERSASTRP